MAFIVGRGVARIRGSSDEGSTFGFVDAARWAACDDATGEVSEG